MRRSRHPEYTLAIIAILVLLFFLWKLRNFLWRKRNCYPTVGSILSSREVGRTEHFIRYELTIGYTDRDGENEVVRLLTCNDAVAASDSVQLSVISRSVQRKGTGRKVQDLDERTYLRFDSEKRTELQQAFHFMEDMELTERKFSLYNLLFCPQLYVERAEFADKKANAAPRTMNVGFYSGKVLFYLGLFILGVIGTFGLFLLMALTGII